MKGIRRWFGGSRGQDPRKGDPYLESLARYLLLLNSGQTPRRRPFFAPSEVFVERS